MRSKRYSVQAFPMSAGGEAYRILLDGEPLKRTAFFYRHEADECARRLNEQSSLPHCGGCGNPTKSQTFRNGHRVCEKCR